MIIFQRSIGKRS